MATSYPLSPQAPDFEVPRAVPSAVVLDNRSGDTRYVYVGEEFHCKLRNGDRGRVLLPPQQANTITVRVARSECFSAVTFRLQLTPRDAVGGLRRFYDIWY